MPKMSVRLEAWQIDILSKEAAKRLITTDALISNALQPLFDEHRQAKAAAAPAVVAEEKAEPVEKVEKTTKKAAPKASKDDDDE